MVEGAPAALTAEVRDEIPAFAGMTKSRPGQGPSDVIPADNRDLAVRRTEWFRQAQPAGQPKSLPQVFTDTIPVCGSFVFFCSDLTALRVLAPKLLPAFTL